MRSDVVAAGGVAGEAQAEAAQIVGVGRQDQIAFVLDDGDLADVHGIARRRVTVGLSRAQSRGGDRGSRRGRDGRGRPASRCVHSASRTRQRGLPSRMFVLRARAAASVGGAAASALVFDRRGRAGVRWRAGGAGFGGGGCWIRRRRIPAAPEPSAAASRFTAPTSWSAARESSSRRPLPSRSAASDTNFSRSALASSIFSSAM